MSLSIVIIASLVALCTGSSLPPGSAFEFNGLPAFAQGVWFADATDPAITMTTEIGDQVTMHYEGGSVRTHMSSSTFMCLDDNTFMSMMTYGEPGKDTTTRCVWNFVNATDRLLASEFGSCPDSFDLESNTAYKFAYRLVDGVLPRSKETVCKNVSTAPATPREGTLPIPVEAKLPLLPSSGPTGLNTGIITGKGNMGIMGVPGAVFAYAVDGSIFVNPLGKQAHECLTDTTALFSYTYSTYQSWNPSAAGIPGAACMFQNRLSETSVTYEIVPQKCPAPGEEGAGENETIVLPLDTGAPKCIAGDNVMDAPSEKPMPDTSAPSSNSPSPPFIINNGTSPQQDPSSSSSTNVGAIVGGVVGGIAFLAAIAAGR